MTAAPAYRCPRCGAKSFHPVDAQQGYCGACHEYTRDADVCFFHGYEPSMAGDYKVCGECAHIWRTEQAFREDEAKAHNVFAQAYPGHVGTHSPRRRQVGGGFLKRTENARAVHLGAKGANDQTCSTSARRARARRHSRRAGSKTKRDPRDVYRGY